MADKLVIGIDGREAAGQPAGKGRYVQQLLPRLPAILPEATFRVFTKQKADVDLPGNASWVTVPGRGASWHREVAKRANQECDAYFTTTSYLTAQFLRIPYVMTVYDLVSWEHTFVPRADRPRASWWHLEERMLIQLALRRAKKVFTISQATADDLARRFGGVKDRVVVTPLAADPIFRPDYPDEVKESIRNAYGLPDRFIMTAGTLEPRKNLVRLLAAYTDLPKELQQKYPLVIVGKRGWQYEPILAKIEDLRKTVPIYYLDFIKNYDLAVLYASATAFCYLSFYEGFGLPVLEAMSSGTPVIASNTSSIPEVAGDAAVLVDPRDTAGISVEMERVLAEPRLRERMATLGRARAEGFSWEETARVTAETLREIAVARPK